MWPSMPVCCKIDNGSVGHTSEQLAKEQGIQAAKDGRESLLLQQCDVPARGSAPGRQQCTLHALNRHH